MGRLAAGLATGGRLGKSGLPLVLPPPGPEGGVGRSRRGGGGGRPAWLYILNRARRVISRAERLLPPGPPAQDVGGRRRPPGKEIGGPPGAPGRPGRMGGDPLPPKREIKRLECNLKSKPNLKRVGLV